MDGAILISRALIDSEVFASEKLLKIWIWLLIKANFKERQVPIKIGAGQSVVTIKRGQLLFGRLSAENELFIDGSTIYKCIKRLEKLKNIEINSNSHYSIITICNYDKYQNFNTYKVTGNEQASNSQVTADEQASNSQVTHLINDNNANYENNVKNENQLFKEQVFVFEKYSDEMLTKFYEYWTRIEGNGKMKFQNEEQFIIAKRLATWSNYKKKVKKTNLWS